MFSEGSAMRRFSVLFLSIVMLLGTIVVGGDAVVAGQDATPAAGEDDFPLVADPALCTVEPRSTEELLDLWFPAEGSPVAEATGAEDEPPTEVTIPVGAPVDDEAVMAGVTATVHEVFSCFEAGDVLRAYALFTDDLARQFGPEPGTPREEAEAFLAGGFPEEATPDGEAVGGDVPEEFQIVAVTDVMDLADGRVGAFVVDEEGTAYVIFEQTGDRWLVDEVIEFSFGEEDEEE